jgi:hypothetical protein
LIAADSPAGRVGLNLLTVCTASTTALPVGSVQFPNGRVFPDDPCAGPGGLNITDGIGLADDLEDELDGRIIIRSSGASCSSNYAGFGSRAIILRSTISSELSGLAVQINRWVQALNHRAGLGRAASMFALPIPIRVTVKITGGRALGTNHSSVETKASWSASMNDPDVNR